MRVIILFAFPCCRAVGDGVWDLLQTLCVERVCLLNLEESREAWGREGVKNPCVSGHALGRRRVAGDGRHSLRSLCPSQGDSEAPFSHQ